jgi:OmpA-OmpF porin, OOP family
MKSTSLGRWLNRLTTRPVLQMCWLLITASLLFPVNPASAADFGEHSPTVEQLIEALNSTGAPANDSSELRTRGIKIVALDHRATAPARSQSSSAIAGGRASMVIQFALNSDRILRASADSLNNLATALNSDTLKNQAFEVIGHTDSSGSTAYNVKLSRRRALSVAEFLSVVGVDSSRATASGRGPTELLSGIAPDSARQRRVEIRIIR